MPTLAACSVDAIVCDPPYHLTNKGGGPHGEGLGNAYGRAQAGAKSTGFMGKAWDGGDVALRSETWAEALRVAKPGAYLLAFGGTRTHHRLMCAIEDAGWEIRDTIMWVYGSGFPKSHNGLWGGTALKPAWEPIIVARRPLIGTVAANVQKHGTGALNIDGCRIGYENDAPDPATNPLFRKQNGYANGNASDAGSASYALKDGSGERNPNTLGRWPANIIHDGSDEVLACFPVTTSGTQTQPIGTGGIWSTESNTPCGPQYGDAGSAARFFYCAKAAREDRNAGCEHLPTRAELIGAAGHAINPMTGRPVVDVPRANHHPTVKPTDLMRYLCRLVTPPGGLILDPFAGSGSTGKAAAFEGFRFLGIELDPEYAEIAEARIRGVAPLFAQEAAP